MQKGGDVVATTIAGTLAPGDGAFHILRRTTGSGVFTDAWFGGTSRQVPLRPLAAARGTLAALAAGSLREPWAAAGRRLALLVTPGPTAPAVESGPRGEMDRTVVRNALSLAYLPRARACYLRRQVASAADADLRGRVRLRFQLERGEVVDARIETTTLGHVAIEACLHEAAFAIEVPRAVRNDAPVEAVLNLLFQPQSQPPGARPPDASALGRDIDLIIGPTILDEDPRELLRDGRR